MAGLIGVPAAVHVGQVESPDGAQRARGREEVADGGGTPYLDAEDVRTARTGVAHVFGRPHAPIENGAVDSPRHERPVGRELLTMDEQPRTTTVADRLTSTDNSQ